jgi:hypothetical protein
MRKHFLWFVCALLFLSVTIISWRSVSASKTSLNTKGNASVSAQALFNNFVSGVYSTAQLAHTGLDSAVFRKAVTGYYNLKMTNKLPQNSDVITVVDFNKPSAEKRMWIIDLKNKALLLNTWVAHGKGSGDNMANRFSNIPESHQSSLGFYVTDDIYFGKHGRSLRLDGVDMGFNDNARSRDIVIHAADYVCQNMINQLGRIGRSFGCPAVSPEVVNTVINTIKGKNMVFINANQSNYSSKYLDDKLASNFAFHSIDDASTDSVKTSL